MSERRFDDFDQFANDYRSIHNKNIRMTGADSDYFSEYKVNEVKQRVGSATTVDRILDLGCGDGNSARFFRAYFPEARVYGIDVSAKSIDVAKKRRLGNCTFQVYDGSNIPFEDKAFDVVFVAGVFHHVASQHHIGLLRECRRVVKRSGQLYVFEHNPLNPLTRATVKDCVFDKDAVLIPANVLRKCANEVGFSTVTVNYTLFFPRWPVFRSLIPLEKYLRRFALGGQYYLEAS